MSDIAAKVYQRLDSIDFLRGLVMVIMLLDHTREFVHADAFRFSSTDLSKTNVLLFFTRWITHFCAPVFVFLAGTSIFLQLMRGKSRKQTSKFLITRGLWLIVLEFTLIRFAIFFNFDYSFLGLASVIWVIGVSMLFLAALIYLPVSLVGVLGIGMMALHNLFDGITVPPATAMAGTAAPDALQKLWLILHQPGFFSILQDNTKLFVAYPLIPWIGVMAAGYWLGIVYTWDSTRRRRWLLKIGTALTIIFVVLRATNLYGDSQAWRSQTSTMFTMLSFLNTTKYPPSLLFLLMTLGPALVVLALAEGLRSEGILSRIFVTFGRVPLFYYLLQFLVAHILAVLISYAAGKSIEHLFLNFPASATNVPPDAGFPLSVVYAVWLVGLLILYPLCRWYGVLKQHRRHFPFNYL